MKEEIKQKTRIYEIVRTKDLKSFYVIAGDREEALIQFANNLNSTDYDKEAKLCRDTTDKNMIIFMHKGDIYCISERY